MTRGLLILTVVASAACGDDPVNMLPDDTDLDDDGYTVADDCDDSDATIHPGADERCDAVDRNCDGSPDTGATDLATWYADADGDGFGDVATAMTACVQPTGYVTDATDCDDAEATAFPGGIEVCDGAIDEDCDLQVDESGATGAATWYADADTDTYGDPNAAVVACAQPTGYVADLTDCDDAAASVHPGAAEVCTDGIDQNCDAAINDGCAIEHCGTISANEIWHPGTHIVTCDIYVEGAAGPSLTIEQGAEVRMRANTGIYVGRNAAGSLGITGGAGISTVKITADAATPTPGSWTFLYFGPYHTASSIQHAVIEYGGSVFVPDSYGALVIFAGTVTVRDTAIRHSGTSGITVKVGGGLDLAASEVRDSVEHGLLIDDQRSTIAGPMTNVVLTGNGKSPVRTAALFVDRFDPSMVFTGNALDEIQIGTSLNIVSADTRFRKFAVPYHVMGTIYIGGPSTSTLTIDPGVVMKFDRGAQLASGATADPGRIHAVGTAAERITMTSAKAIPAPGDWHQIQLWTRDAGSTFAYVDLSYAGANADGVPTATGTVNAYLHAPGAGAAFSNCSISHSASYGIYTFWQYPLGATDMTYANNALADYLHQP